MSGVLFHYVKRQFGPTTLELKKLGGGLKSGVLFHYVKANWTYYFIIKKIGGWSYSCDRGFIMLKKKHLDSLLFNFKKIGGGDLMSGVHYVKLKHKDNLVPLL